MNNRVIVKPTGINVYEDNKGRYVYYDILSRKAYQIIKSDYKKFNILSTRGVTAIAVGYLVFALTNNIWIGLIIAAFTYIGMFVAFRKTFIKGITYIDGFKPKKRGSFIQRLSSRTSKLKCKIFIVLLVALAFLSIINAYTSDYNYVTTILNYALGFVSFVVAIIYCFVLSYKIKNNLD